MSKLVVVLGPTASGKTKLAVQIANQYNGEIISADSRQIYKGMDIGTGKDLNEYIINHKKVSYHLIDILDPKNNYSVFEFQKSFWNIYKKLTLKKKLPIVCGGTGLYIESILLNYLMPNVPPNQSLRLKMEDKSQDYLIDYLKTIDLSIYDKSFHTTKRRIIRSIEIALSNNDISQKSNLYNNIHNPLVLGLKIERNDLLINIKKRLENRIKMGMIDEVQLLINQGIDLNRLKYFGLEYRFIGQYLYNELTYEEMVMKLNYAINRFSKKQMTFFRRMEKRGINISWISIKDLATINNHIKNYICE